MRAEDIVSQALRLPPQGRRAFLAEKPIEGLDAESGLDIYPAWRDEIGKRCREIDEQSTELGAAEEVFERAFAKLQ